MASEKPFVQQNSSSELDLQLTKLLKPEQYTSSQMLDRAFSFLYGEGVAENEKLAFFWMRHAAIGGNTNAMHNLGLFFLRGIGTEPSMSQALNWLKASSQKGNLQSSSILNTLHAFSEDLEDLEISAYSGNALSQAKYSMCLHAVHSTHSFLWGQKSAKQSCTEGFYALGLCYYDGIGTEQNYSLAFQNYLKASESGYSPAQWNLASMYFQGKGTQRSVQKGAFWAQKSAENGYAPAVSALQKHPIIIPTNEDIKALIHKAEQGDTASQVQLGITFLNGEDWLDKDIDKGFLWLEKAAPQCDAATKFELGIAYLGLVDSDPCYYQRGIYWLEQAAASGSMEASKYLSYYNLKEQLIENGTISEDADFYTIMDIAANLAQKGDASASELFT